MKLEAQKREITGKKVKHLRSEGIVPATVFGPKKPSTNIQVDKKEFIKLFRKVGYNKFFDLVVGDLAPAKVLVKEIQKHPVNDNLISVGLYQVDENSKISVEVPVAFIGESPAVKLNLGFIIHNMDSIAVYCLPKDLPNTFEIDIAKLENPGDAITVGDIELPKDVELDSDMDPTSAIVFIAAPQKEEEPEPAAVAEGTEGAEGAAAPAEGTAAPTEEKSEK